MNHDSALHCESEQRRHDVRDAALNGLDYLEVSDDQRTLTVYFLGKAPETLQNENVQIRGGRRIRDIRVTSLTIYRQDDTELDDYMRVTVDKAGDFSTYTFCLVDLDERGRPQEKPPAGFDPRYACVDFSFKVDCPSDLDCKVEDTCPPPTYDEPEIDYLAKDYTSFRRLMLDRMALIVPEWRERHVPDLGIALVEVLAYTGDHLSYYQDAVATEAYLDTARRRISVRRHARLVDYQMHEGTNARAWLHVNTDTDVDLTPADVFFATGFDEDAGPMLTGDDLRTVPASAYDVFEPLTERPDEATRLYVAHNEIPFYTWGDEECCLPHGATRATLADEWGDEAPAPDDAKQMAQQKPPDTPPADRERKLHLREGDVLIFEEVIGPGTNNPADADPAHRHAVRLTKVTPDVDPLYDRPVVEIEWAREDALPFPLCLSAIGPAPNCDFIENVSVARGNVLLVDHGRRIDDESLGIVPLDHTEATCGDDCAPQQVQTIAGRFRPRLAEGRLVFSQPLPADAPASTALTQDPRAALPSVWLTSIPPAPGGEGPLFAPADVDDPTNLAASLPEPTATEQHLTGQLSPGTRQLLEELNVEEGVSEDLRKALRNDLSRLLEAWAARRDLLSSGGDEYHFVVEIDNDGRAYLRFGDGDLGRQPEAGAHVLAAYRVGGGPAGNVGARTIRHIVFRTTQVSGVTLTPTNPMPAQGGIAPEPLADAKLFAPHAFRKELARAITPEDYAAIVERDFDDRIQRAAATLRWTGSWYEVLVAIDPYGSVEADEALLAEITRHLHRYRRIGHDLVVKPAYYVPLLVGLDVCVQPHVIRGHVKAALLGVLSNRTLPGGRPGFFHPDALSFGDGVYLSALVAEVQGVAGVESVRVTALERLYEGPNGELEHGVLPLGPMEIARLDNDPNVPENGQLQLTLRGGR